jgi:hypothetical protein
MINSLVYVDCEDEMERLISLFISPNYQSQKAGSKRPPWLTELVSNKTERVDLII